MTKEKNGLEITLQYWNETSLFSSGFCWVSVMFLNDLEYMLNYIWMYFCFYHNLGFQNVWDRSREHKLYGELSAWYSLNTFGKTWQVAMLTWNFLVPSAVLPTYETWIFFFMRRYLYLVNSACMLILILSLQLLLSHDVLFPCTWIISCY